MCCKNRFFLLAVEPQFIGLSELLSASWQMYFQNPETSVMGVARTVFPGLLLLNMSLLRFSLLYSMKDLPYFKGTLRCGGHPVSCSYKYSINTQRIEVAGLKYSLVLFVLTSTLSVPLCSSDEDGGGGGAWGLL
jgi:hypothetical protein